jgi:hypothetical protein
LGKCPHTAKISRGNPDDFPVIAQIDQAATTVEAFATEDGGVECNVVAGKKIKHRTADSLNNSSGFMSHDDGRETASGASIVPMHVTPADAAGLDTDEQVIVAGLGLLHIDEIKLFVLRENKRLHGFSLQCRQRSKTRGLSWLTDEARTKAVFSIEPVALMIYQ